MNEQLAHIPTPGKPAPPSSTSPPVPVPPPGFLRRHHFAVLFVLLFGYYLWIDLVWHAIDQRPPRWDEGHTLMISEHSYQELQRGEVLKALSLKDVSNTKPGMLPFLSALSYFVIGNSWVLATILANACAMFTILFVLMRAGLDFYDSPTVGAVAFFCFCNINAVLGWSGYYQTDLPMTAAVCATVWLCWAIDRRDFAGRGLPILLALSIIIGMGLKHLYVVMVFCPLALFVVRAIMPRGRPLGLRLRQSAYCLIWLFIGVAVGSSYHWLNIHILQEQMARSKNAALTGGIGAAASAWTVFTNLLAFMPPWTWCSLLAISLVWALAVRRWRLLYPALCVVGGFVGIGWAASWPMSYYYIPILPFGIFVAAGVLGLPFSSKGTLADAVQIRRSVVVEILLIILMLQVSLNRLGTRNPIRVARHTPAILASFGRMDGNPLSDEVYWQNVTIDGNAATLPYPGAWPVDAFMAETESRMKTLPATRPFVLLYCTGSYEWMTAEYGRYEIKKRHLWNTLQIKDKASAVEVVDNALIDEINKFDQAAVIKAAKEWKPK